MNCRSCGRFVRWWTETYFIGRSPCVCVRECARQAIKSSAPVLWYRIPHLNMCLLVREPRPCSLSLPACLRSVGRVTDRNKSRTSTRAWVLLTFSPITQTRAGWRDDCNAARRSLRYACWTRVHVSSCRPLYFHAIAHRHLNFEINHCCAVVNLLIARCRYRALEFWYSSIFQASYYA